MRTFLEQWATQIINAVPNFLAALIIFLISFYVARLLRSLVKRVLETRQAPGHVTKLLVQIVYWTMLVIGLLTALQRIFDVTAFLAGLGILGFTIGFALHDVMQNFAAGIILLVQKPFSPGDEINVSGFDGTILSIDLRTTEIRTFDGRIVTIPNASMLTNAIVNYTRANRQRMEIPLEVESELDPQGIRKLVLEALHGVPGFVGEPAPTVLFERVNGSSISLVCHFWIDVSRVNAADAKNAALRRIRDELQQSGVTLSLPA